MKLFHVSEEENIEEFIPRYSDSTKEPVVWALAEVKLANYLLPRNCPRVCFSVNNATFKEDIQRFFGLLKQVVAIESCWYKKAIATTFYLYEMPRNAFTLFDTVAGYYVANSVIVPITRDVVKQPIKAILKRDIEIRILSSLWQLHDEIVNSSLDFSAIRMKNARPRNKII